MKMPKVMQCTMEDCAYNSEQNCPALAITVGDPNGNSHCDTFFKAEPSGGDQEQTAGVGACKLSDCQFNQKFECSAPDIQVGMQGGQADCLTFQAR